MARALTPQDAHAIVNLILAEMTGQDGNITTVNSSNFVSVGETIWSYGTENVYNAIGLVMGRTLVASRPYRAKLNIINAINTGVYSHRLRKISFFERGALPSGDYNTQLYTNLADGFDNGENPNAGGTAQSTKDQWEQHQSYPMELNFAGSSTMQYCITLYEDQWKNAFNSESDFNRVWAGALTEHANAIEQRKEAFNRMTLCNFMAGIYDMRAAGCTAINLTTEFNNKYNAGGTPATTAELLTSKYKEFLAFFVAEFKKYSRLMTERSVMFHNYPTKTDAAGNTLHLMRHTPYDKQRVILYEPMFIDAEAQVFPEIFNPQYLDIDRQYEGVMYWQDIKLGAGLDYTPAVPNFTTGTQTSGSNVALSQVVGLLYDEDALMVDYQLEAATTTSLEARKRFRNDWLSIARNSINDFTENAILFYMAD